MVLQLWRKVQLFIFLRETSELCNQGGIPAQARASSRRLP